MLHNSRFLSVVACKKFVRFSLPRHIARPVVSVALMILLFAGSVPPAAAASVAREAASRARARVISLEASAVWLAYAAVERLPLRGPRGPMLRGWLRSARAAQGNSQDHGMPPTPAKPPGIRPREPHTKAEREAKVARLELNVSGDLILASRQQMLLSAIPLDSDGNVIHGLFVTWETSDRSVVWINKSGMMTAGNVGKAFITASAGQKKRNVKVTVVGANSTGGQASSASVADSVARSARSEQRGAVERTRLHAHRKGFLAPAMPQSGRDPDSLYTANNAVGTPPGKTKPGAKMPAAATQGSENPGSSNFFFGVQITNLPGRGLDVDLSVFFNSRVWNKSNNFSGATVMSYDVDAGWPAPGFRLGYGKVSRRGFHSFDMVDPDGTRHQLVDSTYVAGLPSGIYDATDGTFIRLTTNANNTPLIPMVRRSCMERRTCTIRAPGIRHKSGIATATIFWSVM